MIKLIIFDLDGVLVDSKKLHFDALDKALSLVGEEYRISYQDHLTSYDGLSTSKKLKMLCETKDFPRDEIDNTWKAKQKITLKIIDDFTVDKRIQNIFKELKSEGFTIACATNSIRETAKLQLIRKGFLEYIDFLYSNQDVNNPKPNAEIYMRCMIKAGVSPDETVIIEDSHIGRKGAIRSGGVLCAVENPEDLSYNKIKKTISNAIKNIKKPKWSSDKMNVLIPMAGAGSRFEQAGYTFPKPLIDVNGKPMIQRVVENINIDATHIFIVQKSHYEKYSLQHTLNLISPGCKIVQVDGVTEGAACTTLLAKEYINNDEPLVLANSDQYVDCDSSQYMYSCMTDDINGSILTFNSTHPKWSYAKTNDQGFVTEVAEKKPISENATVGIYFWKKGKEYVECAASKINKNIRVNNEIYVCPVYNEAILKNAKIKTFHIEKMWGLGTPEDLDTFLKYDIYRS